MDDARQRGEINRQVLLGQMEKYLACNRFKKALSLKECCL
jgi:hypothetical protein